MALRDGQNAGRLSREEIHHDQMVRLMVGRDLKNFYVHSDAEKQPGYFAIDKLRTSRYPDSQVSFDVAKGEILGVAGLVGAGRSEMAQAIFGTRSENLKSDMDLYLKHTASDDAVAASGGR